VTLLMAAALLPAAHAADDTMTVDAQRDLL
jgi:hypothetical protein